MPEPKKERTPGVTKPNNEVDEASEESFPASDPPSWTPSHAGSPEPDDAASGDREQGDGKGGADRRD